MALIALPPLMAVVGLAVFFAWQVSQGTITPKWKPKPKPASGMTNEVPGTGTPR